MRIRLACLLNTNYKHALSVAPRFYYYSSTLQDVLTQFGAELVPGWHFLDSTHVKVHADGSNPAGGQAAQAMGRTKGV